MIVSTRTSDTMLKRAFDKQKTVIISIEKMLDQLMLDPTIEGRECYVVTNEDISAARMRTKFEQAAASKHPAVKIIFINKSSKAIYPNGLQGVDAILQKPKANDLQRTVSAVIGNNPAEIAASNINPMTAIQDIPEYVPPVSTAGTISPGLGFDESMLGGSEPDAPAEPEPVEEIPTPPYVPPMQDTPAPEARDSELIDRVRTAGSVADMSVLMRELTASSLIKDMIETNSTYAGIEEKLKSLNDTIFMVLNDKNIHTLDEKLSKIHAILHDKAFFSSKGDTLLEQRLEEVIDMICSRTSELLQSRLNEIDTAIRYVDTAKEHDTANARLSGLNEERANLIVELRTLEVEIMDIFRASDTLVVGVATKIAENNSTISGNERIDSNIIAHGKNIISDETLTAVRAAIDLSTDKIPPVFYEMKNKIVSLIRLMSKVLDLDSEIIAAQQVAINLLKANNIEDTVVAKTLLKKSLRVFIGEESTGRSIIPYLISAYKSRQNANVLCIDLTGEGKYHQYGIQYSSLDHFLIEQNQKEFMLVSGKADNTVSFAQSVVTALLKAADYYRVINVVMSTEQKELFQTLAQDVLSVNFIVDTNVPRVERMRNVINECSFENVAQRVIINRCDIPVRKVVSRLGLDDRIDFQMVQIPSIPAIADACMNGNNPYGVSAVDLIMEEVIRHA